MYVLVLTPQTVLMM